MADRPIESISTLVLTCRSTRNAPFAAAFSALPP